MRILFEFSEQSVKMTAEAGATYRVDERAWGGSAKLKLFDAAGVPENVYIITAAGSVVILDEEPTESPFSETPHVEIPDEYAGEGLPSSDAPQINTEAQAQASERSALDTSELVSDPVPDAPADQEGPSGFKAMSEHADEMAETAPN